MSYPRACRSCGSEIRLEVLNPVGGLAEPNHNEADCLSFKLDRYRTALERIIETWDGDSESMHDDPAEIAREALSDD